MQSLSYVRKYNVWYVSTASSIWITFMSFSFCFTLRSFTLFVYLSWPLPHASCVCTKLKIEEELIEWTFLVKFWTRELSEKKKYQHIYMKSRVMFCLQSKHIRNGYRWLGLPFLSCREVYLAKQEKDFPRVPSVCLSRLTICLLVRDIERPSWDLHV